MSLFKPEIRKIMAIDPGMEKSAYVVWDGQNIHNFGILENEWMRLKLHRINYTGSKAIVIEQVESFGMPVGHSIFETVFWTGRFVEAFNGRYFRVPRKTVKLHICGQTKARDSNITQALIDRFAPLTRNKGKGTKKEPGFFYGFKRDIWQAFALGVTWWDKNNGNTNMLQ
jgi:hypothetical protein